MARVPALAYHSANGRDRQHHLRKSGLAECDIIDHSTDYLSHIDHRRRVTL